MLLDLSPPPTAIFSAAGDLAANGALDALAQRGKKVPEDISVVGFDGLYFAAEIGLSTVEQPLEAMGRWGAERVLDVVAGKADGPGQKLFEPALVVRGSSGPAPT
jgi:LacI family transcriptional regulator